MATDPVRLDELEQQFADEREWPGVNALRDVADDIAARFPRPHERPQLTLIKGGAHDAS